MAEAVPGCDDQALQHFLTNSPWDDQRVVGQVAHDANILLGGRGNICLILDESGMPKKGDKSVEVSRQWNGAGSSEKPTTAWSVSIRPCVTVNTRHPSASVYIYHNRGLTMNNTAGNPAFLTRISSQAGPGRDFGYRNGCLRCLIRMDRYRCFLLQRLDFHAHVGPAEGNFHGGCFKRQHLYLEDPDPTVPPVTSKKRAQAIEVESAMCIDPGRQMG